MHVFAPCDRMIRVQGACLLTSPYKRLQVSLCHSHHTQVRPPPSKRSTNLMRSVLKEHVRRQTTSVPCLLCIPWSHTPLDSQMHLTTEGTKDARNRK